MGLTDTQAYYRLLDPQGKRAVRVYVPGDHVCVHVQAAPTNKTEEFIAMNQWCIDVCGLAGWMYRAWDFYFDDPYHAMAFKIRWG